MRTPRVGRISIVFAFSSLLACSEESGEPEPSGSGGTGGASGGMAGASPSTGGRPSTGGTAASGAPSATGGVSAGGSGAGGKSAGKANGGTASGGSAAGGRASTGGAANAGAASGGAANAGTSNAGASSGGSDDSSGCGKSGAKTGVLGAEMIEIAGAERTYVLSVPADYQADRAYPLVFAWHGLGGSGSGARAYFRIEQQSKGGALFVYPDGLPNDDGDPAWDLTVDGVDVELFDELVTKLSDSYCVDRSRLFATGHSYGGFFTERLGCSRGDVLRAIAPVAGGPPFGGMTNCTTSVAAWITHGSNDETVDFETGENGRDLWLEANGCGATTATTPPEPCVAYEGCDEPVHWCVHEDGHNWPSFAAAGIWSFFAGF